MCIGYNALSPLCNRHVKYTRSLLYRTWNLKSHHFKGLYILMMVVIFGYEIVSYAYDLLEA